MVAPMASPILIIDRTFSCMTRLLPAILMIIKPSLQVKHFVKDPALECGTLFLNIKPDSGIWSGFPISHR